MCNVCECGVVDACGILHHEDECTYNDCEDCLMAKHDFDEE